MKDSLIERCADFTALWEGCRLKAYRAKIKGKLDVWTIGYGETNGVFEGMTITKDQAKIFLIAEIQKALKALFKLNKAILNDNQIIALVDFIYNCGAGRFQNSTLRMKLNRGDYNGASQQFIKYNRFHGMPIKQLTERRLAEKALFLQ